MDHTPTKRPVKPWGNVSGSDAVIIHDPVSPPPAGSQAGLQADAEAGAGQNALRVPLDDLEEMDWGYQQTLWQGKPFTGVAFEERPDGSLISEADYDEGFQRGSREWYPDGRPREDKRFSPYGLEGLAREWHPDGRPKSEALYEHGIALSVKAWDETGRQTRDDRLTPDDPAYARLRERRRIAQTPDPGGPA